MPFARPTLTELRARVATDVASALPGADALLRYSNLAVMAQAQAALAHGHYGYLDWIALQAVPFTATDEYLEGWAALKGVIRKPATAAIGLASFSATVGAMVPLGTAITRGDGARYATTSAVTATGTSIGLPVRATAPGALGNTDAGTALTIEASVAGILSSGAFAGPATGGADIEGDDDLRSRMLQAYATPAQGGSVSDIVGWALAVPGVTRCWIRPDGMGPGTIVVYFMMDDAEAGHAGFPQGGDGVAAAETRDVTATGDQLALADALYVKQPQPILVYAVAPSQNWVTLTIAGLSSSGGAVRASIAGAVTGALLRGGVPGGVTYLSSIEAAISGVSGSAGFVITGVSASAGSISPGAAGNIASAPGALPVLATITFA